MARVNNVSTLVQGIKTIEELRRFLTYFSDAVLSQFNGKIDFGDNIRSFGPVSIIFLTTNPQKVMHGLGREPLGYFTVGLDKAAIIYTPNQTSFPWNSTQLYLQSNTANTTAEILIF